jgi:hypothetical protein
MIWWLRLRPSRAARLCVPALPVALSRTAADRRRSPLAAPLGAWRMRHESRAPPSPSKRLGVGSLDPRRRGGVGSRRDTRSSPQRSAFTVRPWHVPEAEREVVARARREPRADEDLSERSSASRAARSCACLRSRRRCSAVWASSRARAAPRRSRTPRRRESSKSAPDCGRALKQGERQRALDRAPHRHEPRPQHPGESSTSAAAPRPRRATAGSAFCGRTAPTTQPNPYRV